MHPVAGLATRTARHGFSSMLKYENSPYLGQNGLYAPDKYDNNNDISDYTSDGIIPYPFIQPVMAQDPNAITTVTMDVTASLYASGKNINHLSAMYPEQELFELRNAIDGNFPGNANGSDWVALGLDGRRTFYGEFVMTLTALRSLVWQVTQPNEVAPGLLQFPAGLNNAQAPWNLGAGGSPAYKNFVFTLCPVQDGSE